MMIMRCGLHGKSVDRMRSFISVTSVYFFGGFCVMPSIAGYSI